MSDFADILPRLKGKDVYFYMTKESPDWANPKSSVELAIHYDGKQILFPMEDIGEVSYLVSSLYHCLDGKSILISWGAKDVFSYLKGKTEIDLEIHGSIYDLLIISGYLGIPAVRPTSFKEAISLLRRCLSDPGWSTLAPFYGGVYEPLFSKVLPSIETCCLVDNKRRICVYPTYAIEGQVNGRLKTARPNQRSYNPHSMGPEDRKNLRPRDYDEVFVHLDYRNMEVNVLQWLSGDQKLAGMLRTGGDPYKEIWRQITKQEPTDAHRSLCKDIFLPVVFGQGKASLAKKLEISEEFSARLIHSLVKTFPVAFDWVRSQSADSNNTATDAFGRKRIFESHDHYKIKNFVIQSPASMICLRKLVKLHEALADKASICFHVHDGYCILCKKNEINSICDLGTRVLEEEDDMFPGLKLRVSCQNGHRLDDLKTLNKEVFV